MARIADAVVIGSGLMGCATAYWLARAGIRRTIVVDKGSIASGTTRRDAGLVHTHQRDATTTRLATASMQLFRHWEAEVGNSCHFVETGLVVLAEGQAAAVELRGRVAIQHAAGAETRLVERSDLEALFPQLSFDQVSCAAFEPIGGYIDPVVAAQAMAERAHELGVRFETGTMVRKINQERASASGVATTTGIIESPVIILALGAAARGLLAPFGVSLGLESTRGVIGFFQQPSNGAGIHPTILEPSASSFIRPHQFHLTAAGRVYPQFRLSASELPDEEVTAEEIASLADLISRRLPALTQAPVKRAHAIGYAESPDGTPVIGPVPGVEGLYVAAGFGGNAIVLAPAVGRSLAQWIVDGQPQIRLDDLSPSRASLVKRS